MQNNKLIKKFEQISINMPNRVLKLTGFVFEKNSKEYLEILIFRGFSSSTTHEIETDLEKNVLNIDFVLTKGELLEGPISAIKENKIRENQDIKMFLNESYWK
tara:strand:+ start:6545 stop:6853 length:309 start_codon:yes stop_codon:yes gene_type:complete